MPQPQSIPGLLRIKLGACRTGPTKGFVRDLHAAARLRNRAYNAMCRAWQRWREDHPGPVVVTDADGQPRLRKNGTPVEAPWPLRVEYEGREIGFRTYLYHAGRAVAPELSPAIISMVSGEVESRLKASMPYNHEGRARQRWEAVLLSEVNLDTARSLCIPVPNNNAALCYAGILSGKADAVPREVRDRLKRYGDSGCTLAVPLFSDSAGRAWKTAVVSLLVGAHTGGNRAVIRRVVLGEWKLSDSELVYDEKKGWFFHLTYKQPADSLPGPAGDQVATLAVQGEGEYPFVVSSGERSWKVGHGPLLVRTFHRLNQRRRDMRSDYGTAGSGRRGHGRERNERNIRPKTRQTRNLVNRIAAQAAAEVVRFCTRFGCGKLAWKEPALARRPSLWFGKNHVQWDWTTFEHRLRHQCRKDGVEVVDPENQAPAPVAAPRGPRKSGSVKRRGASPGRDVTPAVNGAATVG